MNYLLLNFLVFFIFFHKNIQNSNAEDQCLNPKFGAQQKIVIEYYYGHDSAIEIGVNVCTVINESDGLFSIKYRMGADVTGAGPNGEPICASGDCTNSDRKSACVYKYYEAIYDDCSAARPNTSSDERIKSCIANGEADDTLFTNGKASQKFGFKQLPALVVNGKYDPCFAQYTYDGMKAYFCAAYENALSYCN